jgi:hypothetical protein
MSIENVDEAPMAKTSVPRAPKRKVFVFLRGFAAALLGIQTVGFISIALDLNNLLQIGVSVAVVLFCIVYARNRLLYLLVLTIIVYAASFGYSHHKVSRFCSSIAHTTQPSELLDLAKQAHVVFRSAPDPDRPGVFFGIVADPFTGGDYVCAVRFDDKHIISINAHQY